MKLHQLLLALPLLFLLSCQKEVANSFSEGGLSLRFNNLMNGDSLQYDIPYANRSGEDFTVSRFKYYISNIALVDTAGVLHKIPDTYFLIDQGKSSSLSLDLKVSEGRYRAVQFLAGVDSIRNVSGAQTGALDPTMDMFWTWSTGYIMAKLEGRSSFSTAPDNRIEYHIGGFKSPNSALRTVTLPFGQSHPVEKGRTLVVRIGAELLDWFDGVNDLTIAERPVIMSPGLPASQFADNYASMFFIQSLQQQ